MTPRPAVCVVGQVLVDVTLPRPGGPYRLRAGGIMHAARALWAIGCPYSLAYVAPDYLDAEIADHVRHYGAGHATRIGRVSGSPNVVLVAEPTEAGPQGYEYLLRDRHQCTLSVDALQQCLASGPPSDVLVFPGGFDLGVVLRALAASAAAVHVDANFEPPTFEDLRPLTRPFETVALSTSSETFLRTYRGDPRSLCAGLVGDLCHHFLLKENRGGSRLFGPRGECVATPAQPRRVQHSVGVGDCFDAVFIALRHRMPQRAALAYASCLAAEYACTTYPDVFRDRAQAWLGVPEAEVAELGGTQLPWELRPKAQVYVAAPDFSRVDRRPIDRAVAALRYHNFVPRLPVREHGEMGADATVERRNALCEADLQLLAECKILLAVLVYDDPGTLIEIGIAVERGVPVVVFDPFGRADNLMLTQLPRLVSSDLDEVMTAVFACAAEVVTP